jgi:aspartyl-tRNA(Asn)/glutamyl-tRNA(Gln) amidotransferase subunit B
MRSKEDAMDYRYFPDPDLPPLVVSDDMLARIKASLPELPKEKQLRFFKQYGIVPLTAFHLSQDKDLADYFEAVIASGAEPTLTANWVSLQVLTALMKGDLYVREAKVSAEQLAALLKRITDGAVSSTAARAVFEALWNGEGKDVDEIIEAKGLKQISDSGAIEKIVDEVLAKSAAQIADYKSGKEKALMSIVGMVMKASAGKANPAQVNEIVKRKIS